MIAFHLASRSPNASSSLAMRERSDCRRSTSVASFLTVASRSPRRPAVSLNIFKRGRGSLSFLRPFSAVRSSFSSVGSSAAFLACTSRSERRRCPSFASSVSRRRRLSTDAAAFCASRARTSLVSFSARSFSNLLISDRSSTNWLLTNDSSVSPAFRFRHFCDNIGHRPFVISF